MGVLQATTLKEMEDAAVAADDTLVDPKTLRLSEDSLEPAVVLPRLLNSMPQTRPQEESGHMKARCRDDTPLVLKHLAPPQTSPMERRHSTAHPQLHF